MDSYLLHTLYYILLSDADDSPTLQSLQTLKGKGRVVKIISEAAFRWEELAIAMGLKYHDIEKIKLDTNNADKASLTIFSLWLEGKTPKPASWEQLMECLRDAGLSSLADNIASIRGLCS